MSKSMIAIDAKQLQGTISLLIAQSGELAGAADSIVSASCKAGLPGYASQAGQAAEELSKMALALASVANVLSVRRSLAIAAMTNPGLNARLYVAELADPDGFYNKLRDIAVGMARDASFTSNAVGGASRTMEALSALLRSGPLLQPSPVELSQMRNALSKGSAAYWKAMGHSPWWGKTMLSALELQAGTSALAARLALVGRGGANLLEAVEKAGKGAGGIALAGLLSGGFQALDDWRSGVRDHRLERLAVSGGVSMGAALVGLGICVVGGIATAGLACFGVVVVAGAAGGVMASEINEDYFTSHRDEIAKMSPDEVAYLRAILDARRAEQWLIKYGEPTKFDLEHQMRTARVEQEFYPRGNSHTVRYYRADGSILCKQWLRGDKITSTTWFDTKGKELDVA